MKKKLVESQYGVLIDVYEIEHEGRVLWFRDYEIEAAAKRYALSIEDSHERSPLSIRRYD